MAWDENLKGPYREIAAFEGSPLRVIAGPGTGKTYALMRRVARLIESGVDPKSILAVSFTRTAANDLVDKLAKLGIPGDKKVNARTLYALCFSILSENKVFEATHRKPRPLMDYEQEFLIEDLASSFGGKKKTRVAIFAFEAAWATRQPDIPAGPKNEAQKKFQKALFDWLVFHEAILVGELIPLTLEFIIRNPASPFAPAYAHVLADEYQDLNRADQELIDALARNGKLTVVGDEDQSIYSFRFANPEGISTFDTSHINTHDESLVSCRRCPKTVISIANSLITHNIRKKKVLLQAETSSPAGSVFLVQHESLQAEITNTAAFVNWYLQNGRGVQPGDVLVLCTRRQIGYEIRNELIRLGRPAQSFFQEESLDSPKAKEGFCLLTLFVKPDDKAALRVWLGLDSEGKRTAPYQRLWTQSVEKQVSPKQILEECCARKEKLPPHCQPFADRFLALNKSLGEMRDKTLMEVIDFLWPVDDSTCADIRGLAIAASTKGGSPEQFYEELRTLVTQPEIPGNEDGIVRVMSLHKSKGLTAKCVVVDGCLAGALPTIKAGVDVTQQQREMEEQRRLFYVALTRTTETLVINYSAMMAFKDAASMNIQFGRRVGQNVVVQASRFLSELGPGALASPPGTRPDLGLEYPLDLDLERGKTWQGSYIPQSRSSRSCGRSRLSWPTGRPAQNLVGRPGSRRTPGTGGKGSTALCA